MFTHQECEGAAAAAAPDCKAPEERRGCSYETGVRITESQSTKQGASRQVASDSRSSHSSRKPGDTHEWLQASEDRCLQVRTRATGTHGREEPVSPLSVLPFPELSSHIPIYVLGYLNRHVQKCNMLVENSHTFYFPKGRTL